MPDVVEDMHLQRAGTMRELLATYQESEDLINIGAYVTGSNPKIDLALHKHDEIIGFLTQQPDEYSQYSETLENLYHIAGGN